MEGEQSLCRRLLLEALRGAAPPADESLSDWMQANFVVTEGAVPGPWRPWAPQRELADCIGDRQHRFVTVLKAIRTGFTTTLTGAICAIVDRSPGQILMLQPRDADCRGYIVDTLEPALEAIPRMAGLLSRQGHDDRQTIRDKAFPGGSFKIRAARSPANLRRVGAKYLFLDEVDAEGYGTSAEEGDRVNLAIGRTLEYSDRKIVMGSTPTTQGASRIWKSWLQSDQRVFEVPCPECGEFSEIVWEDIDYESTAPEEARWKCPKCGCLNSERHKARLVARGRWTPTRPEVRDHAGLWLHSLFSMHANSAWGLLAAQWERAKQAGVAEQQVFINQVLARPWNESLAGIDPDSLAGRVEPEWGRDHQTGNIVLPPDVLLLTAGVDTQDTWLEIVVLGWSRSQIFVLDHHQIHGSTKSDSTWYELDAYLRRPHEHPLGGTLEIAAAAIDAGGHSTDEVYNYAMARTAKNVWAVFGRSGAADYFLPQPRSKKTGKLHAIVGTYQIKQDLFDRLRRDRSEPKAIRFGAGLELPFFQGLTAERPVTKQVRGHYALEWQQIRERNEAHDCMVYAMAVRRSARARCDFDEIEKELRARRRISATVSAPKGWRVLNPGI